MIQLTSGGFLKSVDEDTSFTPGSVLFRGASVISEDNSNFFWDAVLIRLGLGTNDPKTLLNLIQPAASRERIFELQVSDAPRDYWSVSNRTTVATRFVPQFNGAVESISTLACLTFSAQTNQGNDIGTAAMMQFICKTYRNGEDYVEPRNDFKAVTSRNLFAFGRTFSQDLLVLTVDGDMGLGMPDPHSKLEVGGAVSSATVTITASSDVLDVSGVNTVFVNISADIILGGLVGGVDGQVVNFAFIGNFTNHCRFEHAAGIGGSTQDFINHTAADEDIDHGGCVYECNGTNWYDISHARHV